MADYDYDFFVIGAGSGGVRASRVAGSFGARVAVAEDSRLGGTCVNVGCIPKKLLVYASHFHDDFEDAARGYGWATGERSFDWATLIANKDREIERLNGIYARLLDEAGVTRIEGRARLRDSHTVAVGDRHYSARYILVATGGRPVRPEIPGGEHAIVSDDAFALGRLPERVLIVGGGYIAVEFAGIFQGLGAQVTQAYRGPLFLRGFDEDARTMLAAEVRKAGVDLRFDCEVEAIEKTEGGLLARLSDGESREVDEILYAIGRQPNTQGLGLEELGVALGADGSIRVDEYSRSSVESIFAIGDVTNRINLTPVSWKRASEPNSTFSFAPFRSGTTQKPQTVCDKTPTIPGTPRDSRRPWPLFSSSTRGFASIRKPVAPTSPSLNEGTHATGGSTRFSPTKQATISGTSRAKSTSGRARLVATPWCGSSASASSAMRGASPRKVNPSWRNA